jgi:hypothetical protein
MSVAYRCCMPIAAHLALVLVVVVGTITLVGGGPFSFLSDKTLSYLLRSHTSPYFPTNRLWCSVYASPAPELL